MSEMVPWESSSPAVLSICDPAKTFLASKFNYLLFCNPWPENRKLGAANKQVWERQLIANHLDQSLWLTNQKQGAALRSYFLHSSLWERLLIANHLDQSLWLTNQKQGAAVRSHLLHSSLLWHGHSSSLSPAETNCAKEGSFVNGKMDPNESNIFWVFDPSWSPSFDFNIGEQYG
jgi:hypothetical protein